MGRTRLLGYKIGYSFGYADLGSVTNVEMGICGAATNHSTAFVRNRSPGDILPMRRPIPSLPVVTFVLALGHEATPRTDCACVPMTVAPIPREQLPQPEPSERVPALPGGRPSAASASTLLSALSAGPSELLEDNPAFQVFRPS